MRSGLIIALLVVFAGCGPETPPRPVEYYDTAFRQLPPEPVYNRVTWSQLPSPYPLPSQRKSPYLSKVIAFDFQGSTVEEAVQSIARKLGYRWEYPQSVARRPISFEFRGTVDEALVQLGRQAGVSARIDHANRAVRVIDNGTVPYLPPPQSGGFRQLN